MRGIFITFEGPEGAGKSTQVRLLAEHLNRRQAGCALPTREPGGTGLSEKLRELIKHYAGAEGVDDRAEVLMLEAGRAQHVAKVIAPALAAGRIVLCDRFTDSTLAYQGFGREGDLAQLKRLNEYATGGLEPDLTFLFDLPVEVGLARAGKRGTGGKIDRLESLELAFHQRLRNGFLTLAQENPGRFRVLDAQRAPEALLEQILQEYHALLSRI